MSLGLYLHIPFCLRKCHYCNFVVALSGNPRLTSDYLRALEAEAAAARSRYGPLRFDTVYLGGGTPSALSAEELERVFGILARNFSWKEGAEISCEVNPGEVDADKLAALRRAGVNRLSIGVQSTNDGLLRSMNRAHDTADTLRTVHLARSAGFENISMDLIIRLPNQKVEDVSESLDNVVEWNAHQIVIYDLSVHENTYFGYKRRRGELILPTEAEHDKMFQRVEERLTAAGFEHYEVSSFAKPGYESKHNLIYWHNEPYLGLGPGAFSYMDGCRYVYAQTVTGYLAKTARGDWSRDEEDSPGPEERESETLLTALRLKPGIDLSRVPLIRGRVERDVAGLAGQGLVEYDGRVLKLTRKGRYLAESVLGQLAGRS